MAGKLSFGGDKPKYPQTPGYGDYVERHLDGTSAMPAPSQVVPTSRNPFWGKTIPTYGPPAPYYNLWQGVSEEDRMKPYVISPGDITDQYSLAQPQVIMQRPVESDPDMPRTYANPLGIKPGGTPGWITRFLQALGDNGVGGYVASGSGVKERKDFENPEWNPFTSIVEQAMNPNSAAPEKQPVSQEWLKQMTDKVTKEQEKTKKNQLTSYIGDGHGGYFTDFIYTDAYGNKYVFEDSILGKGWRLIEVGKLPSLTGANKWYYSYPQYSGSGGIS